MHLLLLVLAASAPDTLWANVTSGGVYSTVPVGDLDGDGVSDVVSGVNFWDEEPTLWCMSGADGTVIWNSDQYKGIYQDEGLTGVGDMNGDGYGDVLLATPGGYAPPGRCMILVSGLDGSLIWQWSAYENISSGAGWGYSCCTMEDQTGDSLPEFLGGFGSTGSANTSAAACLNGVTGDTLWTRTTADAVEDVLAIPDITGDGVQDAVLGIGGSSYTDYTLEFVSGADGSLIWNGMGGGDVMCVDDLDRYDTLPWVVSCSFSGEVRCYDLAGTQQWTHNVGGMLLDVESGPDLNGDGIAEVALAGDNGGTLCLDGATGNTLWSYPTGSNTWSVAWADSVYDGGGWVPAIAGGSVNGRSVSLVNAETGDLIWAQDFTERVYNVGSMSMDAVSDSPIILVGLQDQESQPYHAWAFLSSGGTGVESGGSPAVPGRLVRGNPAVGTMLLTPPEGDWSCGVFDLSGRRVWSGSISGESSLDISGWKSGCYFVVMYGQGSEFSEQVTVIRQ